MDKTEIESFFVWYIPAVLLSFYIFGSLHLNPEGIDFGAKLDFASSYLGSIICAAWLWLHTPKYGLNKWLWSFIGLGLGLYAIFFYFIYRATNKFKNENASKAGTDAA